MYGYHIERMATAVLDKMDNGDLLVDQAVREALDEYWSDKIAIVWDIDDIRGCVTNSYPGLLPVSDEFCKTVLIKAHRTHSANRGVSWTELNRFIFAEAKMRGMLK